MKCPHCGSREYAMDPHGAYWCWSCDRVWFSTRPTPRASAETEESSE